VRAKTVQRRDRARKTIADPSDFERSTTHHTMIVPTVMTSQRGPAVGLGVVASF
jgi:hypothetical protein